MGLGVHGGVSRHLTKLDVSEKRCLEIAIPNRIGGKGSTYIVSEPGLYRLIMRSDKTEALAFQHWIASEVLPSIRKTGKYALADHGREAMPLPMDIAEAVATALGQFAETQAKIVGFWRMHR